jgi:hypothetical protein
MLPKPIKQSLKYNSLMLPKEHKNVLQLANMALWNELNIINMNYPKVQIQVDHIVREFGNYYGIDLRLRCKKIEVQQMLDAAYERNIEIPRFEKHKDFDAMVEGY